MKNIRYILFILAAILLITAAACNRTEPAGAPKPEKTTNLTVSPVPAEASPSATEAEKIAAKTGEDPEITTMPAPEPEATTAAPKTAAPTVKPTIAKTPAPTKKPATPEPTKKPSTPAPTNPLAADVYKTITYEGKTYKVLMGRNGNPYLIKDRTTMPPQLQPYVYPYDIEGIRKDVTLYAKSQGMNYFKNPQGIMTDELAQHCSWNNPGSEWYYGDKNFDKDNDEVDEVIYTRKGYRSEVNLLAEDFEVTSLALWFRELTPSKTNTWNGQPTKQYAIYWMYGWGVEMPTYNP